MKHIFLIFISLTLTCGSFYFQYRKQSNFNNGIEIRQSLDTELKALEDDLRFLNHHAQTLSFLEKKGWFGPQSRLIAAEKIKDAAGSLNKISFTFEPETVEDHKNGCSFKVSRIVLETSAVLDTLIYDFIHNMLKSFPGILILRKLSLSRHETLTANSLFALRRHKQPDFICGEIIFDWVVMGE